MSWEYWLVPTPSGSSFTPEALDAMRAWWDARPTYVRADGAIVLCPDLEYRDYVLATNKQDEFTIHVEVIRLYPDRITIAYVGWQQNIDVFYEFTKFCQSRWPCEVLDDTKRPTTAEEYRHRLHTTFDVESSRDDDA